MKKKKKVVLVGRPNVGKSVIFNRITDSYAVVSNYPGTTVEISRGQSPEEYGGYEVLDTPGIYSLMPFSAEEEVTLKILREEEPDLVVQVVEAKNIERMLPLTFQLMEAGFPLVLVVNMLDEAGEEGFKFNLPRLAHKLGIPVAGTVSIRGKGIDNLKKVIRNELNTGKKTDRRYYELQYPPVLEDSVQEIVLKLKGSYGISKKALALLLLQGDTRADKLIKEREGGLKYQKELLGSLDYPLLITMARQKAAREILKGTVYHQGKRAGSFKAKLNTITMHPWWGFPFLAVVLYYGLYKFVGVFGAGTMVGFIDGYLFGEHIFPFLNKSAEVIPYPWLRELLISDFGIFNLVLRYGLAVILPIVSSFFLFFSLLEDSGYLPRLAMLLDKLFKKFGLNGRSVIPFILGLGCGTMAVLAARTLETKRERFIAVLLLAVGIPCSAQLGLIMAMLSREPGALLLWGASLLIIIIITGCITDKVLPGKSSGFYMEIPSLRFPNIQALLCKTSARIIWYMKEIIPLFLIVSLIMWAGSCCGLIPLISSMAEPVINLIGLPKEMAPVFILGFFRRDYGAAGLYDLLQSGLLSQKQLVVASLALSLFLPCIAQFAVILKEQGAIKGIAVLIIVFSAAFSGAYILNLLLQRFDILSVLGGI